jgi:hypothetical protein
MAEANRKDQLRAELDHARDQIGGHALGLKRSLSPAEAIKRGVRHRPVVWFAGAVLAGLLLSRIPARRRQSRAEKRAEKQKEKETAGNAGKAALLVTVLKFGLDLAKPSLTRWLRDRVTQMAMARHQAAARGSSPGSAHAGYSEV